MIRNAIFAVKSEITSYSSKEKCFVVLAMLCSFCITAEYAVTKPTSSSIFITQHSAELLPYAWLAMIPLNFLIVSLYNRFFARLGCWRIFLYTTGAIVLINAFSALYVSHFPALAFSLYVWKDIYIMLMFQQLWSIIHSVITLSRAKYLYGLIFGIGGLGSVTGSMIPSFFAIQIGSELLLLSTIPIYILFGLFYYFLLKKSDFLNHSSPIERLIKRDQFSKGFQLIYRSYSLKLILLVVVLMQLAVTMIDYQFNVFLAESIPNQDMRTQFSGSFGAIVNGVTVFFQLIVTFVVLHWFGLRKVHFAVPIILLANSLFAVLRPTFLMTAYVFGVIKSFDYSIVTIIKEMLYIPLKSEEKFQAKAVIDVFIYRSSKALSSIFIIVVQYFAPFFLLYTFTWGPILFFAIWFSSVFLMFKKSVAIA